MRTKILPDLPGSPTQVSGGARRRMLAVRIAIISLIGVATAIFVYSLPISIQQASTSTTATQIGGGQLGFSGVEFAIFRATLDVIIALAFIGVAVLLMLRRSHDPYILFIALTLGLTATNYSDAFYALYVRLLPPPSVTLVIGALAAIAEITQLAAFFTFPNGKFVPRWTRWLVLAWIPYRLAGWMLVYLSPLRPLIRPYDITLQFLFFGVGIVAQIVRYRRAVIAVQRQQTKWIIFGMTVATLVLLVYVGTVDTIPVFAHPGTPRLVYIIAGSVLIRISLLLIPISVAASVLRYRLWDIDLIISRSLVYGTLTILLAALFAGSVFLIDQFFRSMAGGVQSALALAISGAVFGVIFQPARRGLQRFVDRRFYRIEIDYERAARERQEIITGPQPAVVTHIGRFSGLEIIGRGGMGEVYRAEHPDLKRTVAIKVLTEPLAAEGQRLKRFEREAQVISRLNHPNIVKAHEFGHVEGAYYLVMDYLHGRDLARRIAESGPLPFDEIRRVMTDVAAALDYAHREGLVHRDIKASNVMLAVSKPGSTETPRAILMDFGIARVASALTHLTQTELIGTFDTISPEQIHDAKDVDGRADIYSLGIVLYQMLTGELPFKGTTAAALLMAHLFEPVPDPRALRKELSEEVYAVIQKATDKNRDRRYASAGEMVKALS